MTRLFVEAGGIFLSGHFTQAPAPVPEFYPLILVVMEVRVQGCRMMFEGVDTRRGWDFYLLFLAMTKRDASVFPPRALMILVQERISQSLKTPFRTSSQIAHPAPHPLSISTFNSSSCCDHTIPSASEVISISKCKNIKE